MVHVNPYPKAMARTESGYGGLMTMRTRVFASAIGTGRNPATLGWTHPSVKKRRYFSRCKRSNVSCAGSDENVKKASAPTPRSPSL